ncbi:MAG: hypothetical protein JWM58_3808 [Rhizobium sp.]|nr:hypothetical protein [Rhizobium sp.]
MAGQSAVVSLFDAGNVARGFFPACRGSELASLRGFEFASTRSRRCQSSPRLTEPDECQGLTPADIAGLIVFFIVVVAANIEPCFPLVQT